MDSNLAMRSKIADLASDASLEPAERISQLREMRESVRDADLLGQIEGYIGSLELRREAEAIERSVSIVALRENANIRDYLISTGQSTAEELDQIGYLSHAELDAREADGTLAEAIDLSIEEARGVQKILRWTKGFEKGGEFRPTRGGSAGRRVTKALDTGREKGDRKAKPPKSGVTTTEVGQQPPSSPGIEEELRRVREFGLNDWPTLGPKGKELLGDAKDSQELHTVPVPSSPGTGKVTAQRRYKPDRLKLHGKIAGEFLAGLDHEKTAEEGRPVFRGGLAELLGEDHPIVLKLLSDGFDALTDDDKKEIREAAAAARNGEPPVALFMAGGPASGKTSALQQEPDMKPGASVEINSDDVKVLLPEFQELLSAGERAGASVVHEESSDVAKKLVAVSQDLGLNLVMDGTGNSEPGKFIKKLEDMGQGGYVIDVLGVTVPTDVAVVRGMDRAKKSGRWVPEPEIRKSHRGVSQNFPEIMAAPWIRNVVLYQNSGPTSEPPTLIGQGTNGEFEIADQDLMDEFLAKADEPDFELPDDTEVVKDLAPDVAADSEMSQMKEKAK